MADTATAPTPETASSDGESRRDFLLYTTTAVGALGTGMMLWPLVNSLNPAADTLALSTIEVNLSEIDVGQSVTVKWRGKPVFIRRRSADEIAEAESVAMDDMIDPEADADRVQNPEWLILVGVCTHLGCVPLGQKEGAERGEYNGWFCPCHGSHYDTSGRIRKGPAPKNLPVPEYAFINDSTVKIG